MSSAIGHLRLRVVFFRPVVLRAVVFFRPPPPRVVFLRPPLMPPDAGIGAGGGGVPGSGDGQLDAGSCWDPDHVSPRLPCSIRSSTYSCVVMRRGVAYRVLGIVAS